MYTDGKTPTPIPERAKRGHHALSNVPSFLIHPRRGICTDRYALCYGVLSSHRTPEVDDDVVGWNAVNSCCLLKRNAVVHVESENRGMRW